MDSPLFSSNDGLSSLSIPSKQMVSVAPCLFFELALFVHIYNYARNNACSDTRESRDEAIRILKLTIDVIEKANASAEEIFDSEAVSSSEQAPLSTS